MTLNEEEKKLLERLANSKDGEILSGIFEKMIDELRDVSLIPDDNFEVEGRVRKRVIVELRRFLNTIKLLKENKEENKTINEYV